MKRSDYIEIRNKIGIRRKRQILILHLGIDLSMWTTIALLCSQGLSVLSAPILSVLMYRSFSMMHDAVHGAISDNKWLNSLVGILYGSIALLPFEQWKAGHLKHHQWSGNIEKDPVMAFLIIFPKMSSSLKLFLSFCWKAWIPALAIIQHLVFWSLSIKEAKSSRLDPLKLLSLVIPAFFWGSLIVATPSGFGLLVIAPALLMYLIGVEVMNLPHHLQLTGLDGEEKLPAWEQYKTSRSCIYPSWISKFIVLNFNLHAEHHMYPDSPWYYLSQINQEVSKKISSEMHTDSQFSWILKNRKRPLAEVLYPENSQGAENAQANTA